MNNLFLLLFVAFLVNIPLGYIRENRPRFSFSWFFWIHASIPLLIYLRIIWGIAPPWVPFSILLAVAGQIVGSRIRRKGMAFKDYERLAQIPDLKINPPQAVSDEDVEVVLCNMGGPKTSKDIKDFQERLFNDPLLIRFPLSFFLQKLFAWLMVSLRLQAVIKRYALLKMPLGGSPIYPSTENQLKALSEEFKRRGRSLCVSCCFNYSSPLPEEVIKGIRQKRKKYILPLSLYPHYSKATTGSSMFYLQQAAKKFYPEIKFLKPPPYYLHDSFIKAFGDRIREMIKPEENLNDFYLIFSAHGLPKYFLQEGDPYAYEIHQTVSKVLGVLKRNHSWVVAFQSAVGPFQWLTPYMDRVIESLAYRKIKKVLVVPIAFVSDHIETTVEIDIEYKKLANDLGITDFRMSKALECHPGFITALADSVEAILPRAKNSLEQQTAEYEPIKMEGNYAGR